MKSLGLNSPISLAVAALLKKSRRAAKLTQTQLANRLHWKKQKIIMLEKGQQQLRIPEFVALFESLDLDPRKVLGQAMQARDEKAPQPKKGRP